MSWRKYFLAGLALCLALPGARAADVQSVRVPSGAEIVSERYPAAGGTMLVWLTGQYGRVEAEHRAAADLAAHGVETWVTDLYEPYFLPPLPSSIDQVPEADLQAWLAALHAAHPGRRIILGAPGRQATLALRAAASGLVDGAVLAFPILYKDIEPGEMPEYDPVVDRTRLDIVILQPHSSAGYWWRERLKERLEAAGSRVRVDVLDGLRDGFFERGDVTDQETAAAHHLGDMLYAALQELDPGKTR
ncbi:hypothetical protein EZJ19_12005 [Parasulfuritortus cantonensis]|uniref:Uncharacterized protein n=1 Tax=Parasulfuritortus cantonensis TaxID=2528202 RepID=A0A4R1B8Z2_9PROT|nr:hypothetical protein [Parasulfuritortus cantonensis]TCJ12943.1 hypothetical protein EZJ19_12005 [Parasulfuritortus cantonensis]